MKQKEYILEYIDKFGSVIPAKMGGKTFVASDNKEYLFPSEIGKRCRELMSSIANRLLELIGNTPFILPTPYAPVTVTVSIGGAVMIPNETPVDIFKRADQAAYAAKQAGRNRVIVAS